jgi:hypothetical protein
VYCLLVYLLVYTTLEGWRERDERRACGVRTLRAGSHRVERHKGDSWQAEVHQGDRNQGACAEELPSLFFGLRAHDSMGPTIRATAITSRRQKHHGCDNTVTQGTCRARPERHGDKLTILAILSSEHGHTEETLLTSPRHH